VSRDDGGATPRASRRDVANANASAEMGHAWNAEMHRGIARACAAAGQIARETRVVEIVEAYRARRRVRRRVVVRHDARDESLTKVVRVRL
jgi:hypothetical protein